MEKGERETERGYQVWQWNREAAGVLQL